MHFALLVYNAFSRRSRNFSGALLTTRAFYARRYVSSTAPFSSVTGCSESSPIDSVNHIHEKILDSLKVKRTMSPNAWLWSLISRCENREDVRLLFDALQNLRIFRLSNLRIHDNFNFHLCEETVKACLRVGAIDFGKKALSRHNVYGLTPTVGSANKLLSFAKDRRDSKLLNEAIQLMKRNKIKLQPSTADVVLSACSELNDWKLMSKYSKMFLDRGIKLRKTSFDVWMNFAAKRGDIKALKEIEQLRSELAKHHTLLSGFAYAKGLILERKPQEAAAIIMTLYQALPVDKKSGIEIELQKLVNEWPFDVVKFQEDNNKDLVAARKLDISTMIASLSSAGLNVNLNMEDFFHKGVPC